MDDELGDYELSFAGGSQLSPDPRPKRHRAGAPALGAAGAPATPSAHPVTPESVTPSARGPAQAQRLPTSAAFDPFQFPAPPPPHPGAPIPGQGPSRHHGPRTQTRAAPLQQHPNPPPSPDPGITHGHQHQQHHQHHPEQQVAQGRSAIPPTHGSPGSDPLHAHLEDPTRPLNFIDRNPINDIQHHIQRPAARGGAAGGAAGGVARGTGARAVPGPAGDARAATGGAGGGGAGGIIGCGTLLEHLIRAGALDPWVVEDAEASGMPRLVEGAVPLQVDISVLMQSDPQLGAQLITDPAGSLYSLLDELHAEGISASPCPRLYVRPTQVPLPCQPVPALLAALTHLPGASCWASSSTHHPTIPFGSESHHEPHHGATGPHALLVCCYGVVVAASSVGLRPHSRLLACGRCGEAAAVLEERGAAGWPGCSCGEGPGVAELQEDLSGRVMVPCQDLWLAGLSSALPVGEAAHANMGSGAMGYGALPGSVRLAVGDDLAGVARVGDVVRVVGMARLLGPPGRSTTAASTASAAPSSSLYATATASIDALSMAAVHPFRMWGPPARTTPLALTAAAASADGLATTNKNTPTASLVMQSGRPLQTLVDLVCQAQGRPVEPLLALAMLLSAVAAGGATAALGAEAGAGVEAAAAAVAELGTAGRGPHPHLQALTDGRIRLLVGHPASDPLCPRLLRGCAALLSPISVALAPACAAGIALYDDPPAVMPRLVAGGRLGVDGSGQAGASGVAHGSLLLTAGNYGVAVVEAEMLTNKHRSALNELLGRPSLPLAPGRPELTAPLTTTVWAAAPRSGNALAGVDELAFSGSGGGGGRRWGRGAGGGSDRALPWGGLDESQYDIVLHHVAGDDLVAAAALGEADEAGGMDPFLLRALRQHMAAAAQLTAQRRDPAGPSDRAGGVGGGEGRVGPTSPHPQLTGGALELLMRYYVAVRQSGVQVTQAATLGSLVRVATACARLHLRTQVLAAPDCVLAVLLMEESLGCRFGDAYMRLGLPPLPDGAEGADGVEGEEGEGGGGPGSGIDGALAALGPVLGRLLQGFASGGW